VFCWTITAHSQSPEKKKDEKAQAEEGEKHPAENADSLGRSTPHGTVFGFLQVAQNGNYVEAAKYLQLSTNERSRRGGQLARQLHNLMDTAFLGRVGVISDQPEGSAQNGIPPDHERIGVFRLHGNETSVDLVRVANPRNGSIWLFSSQTLAAVP